MHILIVEDDGDIASFLKRGLVNEGHDVEWAGSGHAAVAQGTSKAFDAIILDSMLPDISGLDVCRALRAQGPNENATIIMLSARDTVDDRIEGLSAGADDYVVKPFAFEELLARVNAQDRRQRQSERHKQAAKLVAGPIVLDLALREVSLDGRRVELTERECDLLAFFMRHANEPLPRQTIFDALWEGQGGVSINVVDVYVGYLRRKLERGDETVKPLIHTVRGLGFVLRILPRLEEESPDTSQP